MKKRNFYLSFVLVLLFVVLSSFAIAEEIGKVKTKGFIFKDTVSVVAFDDPSIKGVTCYTTVVDKALSFSDSSSVSLSCRQTGIIKGKLKSTNNIFKKSKNLFFKKTVVDRFYDKKRGVLVYLTYTKATSGENMSNSVSVVVIK